MENKKEKNSKISKSSEKKGNLLIQIDEIMQTFDNEYGPLMLKELEDRLIKTINDFQKDSTSLNNGTTTEIFILFYFIWIIIFNKKRNYCRIKKTHKSTTKNSHNH